MSGIGKCESDACGKLGQRTPGSAKGLASVGNGILRPLFRVPDALQVTAEFCQQFCQNMALFRQACFINTFANVFFHLKYLKALIP